MTGDATQEWNRDQPDPFGHKHAMSAPLTPHDKHYADVLGLRMAYLEVGRGDPIVFLHGNPTSSFLWRNVIPHVKPCGRCLAPDLIGMGDSDKLPASGPSSYRFVDHRRYLDALLEQLGVVERVTLVVHDWGSALGFDWANRHRQAVAAIAYMEAIVRPFTWEEWSEPGRGIFQAYRSSAGEDMILERNHFVERVLPASVLRTLSEEEMNAYRAPFRNQGEDRRPTLSWPRELPIDGEPADVVEVVEAYGTWLSASEVPKLFVNADPGAILTDLQRQWVRNWPNQHEVTVPGNHFLQEDSADAIGTALADWLTRLPRI
jgi:haloalkane dehalogenase